MGDCQNYGPFLGPYYNTGPNTGPNLGDPKRDHNFDNPPYESCPECARGQLMIIRSSGLLDSARIRIEDETGLSVFH